MPRDLDVLESHSPIMTLKTVSVARGSSSLSFRRVAVDDLRVW